MSASQSGVFTVQEFQDAGVPLVGGRVYTYAYGTTTHKTAYTDEAGTVPHAYTSDGLGGQYIELNARGELPAALYLSAGAYDISLKRSDGSGVWTRRADPISDTYQTFVDGLTGSAGSNQIGFIQTGSGAVASNLQSKARERVSVFDYGVVGDGLADDTAKLNACYVDHAGKHIDHGNNKTFLVSSSLFIQGNSTYYGKSKIKAKSGSGITGAVMYGNGVSNAVIFDLEVDANGDNSGANYGIKFSNGSNNYVDRSVTVHDTRLAGGVVESEDGTQVLGVFTNCGRTGAGTDNHGVMAFSNTSTPLKNVKLSPRVSGAARKGVTVYSASPGTVIGALIDGAIVDGCGLGGIYVANAAATTDQDAVVVSNNISFNNYVNYEISNCKNVSGSGNISRSSSGGSGVEIVSCTDVNIGINDSDAKSHGISISSSLRVNLPSPVVARPNRIAGGYGAGIRLVNSTYCTITTPNISDSSGPLMTHGIAEEGTSDYNQIICGPIQNFTSASVLIVGSNSLVLRALGRLFGVGTNTPLNTLDVDGGLTVRDRSITLANGANNNIVLPAKSGTLAIQGPTGAYSITSIAGGHSGRKITLLNYTSQTLTIKHDSASASAGNWVLVGGAADLTVGAYGGVELTYVAIANAWMVTGYKG